MKELLLGVAGLGLAGVSLSHGLPALEALPWLVVALALELRSAPLPHFGVVSAASVPLLALGPAGAWGWLAVAGLRYARAPRRPRDLWFDGFPLLAALLAPGLWRLPVYVLVLATLPFVLAADLEASCNRSWGRAFLERLPWLAALACCAGLGLPTLAFALPLLWLLPRQADSLPAQIGLEEARLEALQTREKLVEVSQVRAEQDQWVAVLAQLLESTRAQAATLDEETLLARVELNLRQMVPHEAGWVVLDGQVRRHWGPPGRAEVAVQVAEAVLTRGPLRVEDVRGRGLEAPAPDQNSLLAVPLAGIGAIILTARQMDFLPPHQHFVLVTGTLTAIFLSNTRLYLQVQDSQRDLLHANKMAAVGQLAAGVAHEINNPLMAIQVNLDLLEPVTEDDRESKATMAEAVMRCRDIVAQLLNFSRKNAAEENLDLGQLVEPALRLLPEQKPLELQLAPAPVRGSREELVQLVRNLLSNAFAAGQRVQVRTGIRGQLAVLEVKDDGPGIAPELRQKVFEPFYTTREVGAGTGLGLYLAYTIAANHGGLLEVAEEGPGACLRLSLPVRG